MNTKERGDISTAMVTAALLRNGETVLTPYGDRLRYDLVLDRNGKFLRIQVKTGRIKAGAVRFKTCSSYAHRGKKDKDYREDADCFGVYCPDNGKVYLVPVIEVGRREGVLRVEETKNNQTTGIRLGSDFELDFKLAL